MAVTLGRVDNNLLSPGTWAAGNGGTGIFGANGDTGEQNRYTGTNPWGQSALVWQTVPSGNGNADGGWNTSGVSIDNTSLYRFSVWVRRTSATGGGTFYFGIQSNLGTAVNNANGLSNGNPYWDYRSTGSLTQNQWYLVVGHCFPWYHNGTQAHPDSGFYTTSNGTSKVALLAGDISQDCRWTSGTTTAVHRTYHYYCGDSTTRLELYWPRIDKVDGSEPSLQQLLTSNNPGDGIRFSDNTVQATKPPGMLGQDFNDRGNLIDIACFTNSGTWTNPGASMVHVKLIGGGGGGAGYCEGGGAGGYAEGFYNVTGVGSVAVTVGGGGGYASYYAAAGNGGTSSFGGYLSASGGYGANQNYSHSGGHGGNSFGGAQFSVQGGAGCGHINSVGHSTASVVGGSGYYGGPANHIRNHGNLGWAVQHGIGNGAPGSGGAANVTDWGYQHPRGHSAGEYGTKGMVTIYSYK